ncbi:hypothetical protein DPMN_054704 [Dreissena polymorpha]|uniref:Uncharacterized protein n=1 Tax=Dreissena polymorpha TaxID=45954 RepID=A0A9D4HTB7_DREPO|nr:hypothetical protein DPMN_054704 [Dreissena polymorpha]
MLFSGTTSQGKDVVVGQLRAASLSFLIRQVNSLTRQEYDLDDLGLLDDSHMTKQAVMETVEDFCIPPFSVAKG